jgi:hypothetical protein
MRMSVHGRIDPYWRNGDGRLKRKQVYAVVATLMRRRSFRAGTAREDDIRPFDAAWPQIYTALSRIVAAPRLTMPDR